MTLSKTGKSERDISRFPRSIRNTRGHKSLDRDLGGKVAPFSSTPIVRSPTQRCQRSVEAELKYFDIHAIRSFTLQPLSRDSWASCTSYLSTCHLSLDDLDMELSLYWPISVCLSWCGGTLAWKSHLPLLTFNVSHMEMFCRLQACTLDFQDVHSRYTGE